MVNSHIFFFSIIRYKDRKSNNTSINQLLKKGQLFFLWFEIFFSQRKVYFTILNAVLNSRGRKTKRRENRVHIGDSKTSPKLNWMVPPFFFSLVVVVIVWITILMTTFKYKIKLFRALFLNSQIRRERARESIEYIYINLTFKHFAVFFNRRRRNIYQTVNSTHHFFFIAYILWNIFLLPFALQICCHTSHILKLHHKLRATLTPHRITEWDKKKKESTKCKEDEEEEKGKGGGGRCRING